MKIVQGLAGVTLGMVGGLLVVFSVLGGPPATGALNAEASEADTVTELAEPDDGRAVVRVSLGK